jgi:hypothetical protein
VIETAAPADPVLVPVATTEIAIGYRRLTSRSF